MSTCVECSAVWSLNHVDRFRNRLLELLWPTDECGLSTRSVIWWHNPWPIKPIHKSYLRGRICLFFRLADLEFSIWGGEKQELKWRQNTYVKPLDKCHRPCANNRLNKYAQFETKTMPNYLPNNRHKSKPSFIVWLCHFQPRGKMWLLFCKLVEQTKSDWVCINILIGNS